MSTPSVVGRHEVWREGELIGVRFVGGISGVEAATVHDLLSEVMRAHGRCVLLGDMTRMTSFDAEARRETARWNRTHTITGAAMFGGSFTLRAVASLTVKALRMLSRDPVEVVLVSDEAQARRWLTQRLAAAR